MYSSCCGHFLSEIISELQSWYINLWKCFWLLNNTVLIKKQHNISYYPPSQNTDTGIFLRLPNTHQHRKVYKLWNSQRHRGHSPCRSLVVRKIWDMTLAEVLFPRVQCLSDIGVTVIVGKTSKDKLRFLPDSMRDETETQQQDQMLHPRYLQFVLTLNVSR